MIIPRYQHLISKIIIQKGKVDRKMENEKKRVLFIDYFKALLMILVIMGHINFANTGIKAWIYSFHMPAFFFVSGMVLNFAPQSNKVGIIKYVDRLIVPFFLWAMVFASFTYPNLLRIIYGSYSSIAQAGALTSLWFLPVLFLAVLMLNLMEKFFNIGSAIWIEIVCIILAFGVGFALPHIKTGYPWSVNVSFIALGFMLLGRLSKTTAFRFKDFCFKRRSWGLIMCFVMAILCLSVTFIYQFNLTEKGFILMGNARYGNPLLFVSCAIFGILMTMFLSLFIETVLNGRKLGLLSFVGQNTLCIFAVQKPIIQLFSFINRYVEVSSIVMLILVTVATLLISCLICLFFNKYLPAFVGKGKVFSNQK